MPYNKYAPVEVDERTRIERMIQDYEMTPEKAFDSTSFIAYWCNTSKEVVERELNKMFVTN